MYIPGNERPEAFADNYPPGAICVASGELSRYPAFTHSLAKTVVPQGTTIEYTCGLNVASNFNIAIRDALAKGAHWVWIMGDDHEYEEDALLRLLAREVDIIVPLVARRQPPFIPVLFKEPSEDADGLQFPPYHWSELPEHGLLDVHMCGSAGMVIRRHVLEAMDDPWFETGHMGKEFTNEDTYFCLKARQAGFTIQADMDVQLDHWTPVSLRPVRSNGQWAVGINLSNDAQAILSQQTLINMTHMPNMSKPTARIHSPLIVT